ncbi:(2Fe-2S)-binding protein [Motiliproteus sediminis]|uniref:(2Fe-2S)-binding protein n=1 Tax=Motiliproteus sediminis TaxID=1468178 RepID=UPI001AEFD740|nr:(2Fe-2S)-binding protein [Motiliproteus sediminis]
MASDSAFKRLPANPAAVVNIWVEGQPITARAGESVAAAVLAAGLGPTRTTPVSAAPRAPYCMMGVCFECLMEIDGQPNSQGCMTQVSEGMQVRFQQGAREPLENAS